MLFIKVDNSSTIKSACFNEGNGDLLVNFLSGGCYKYEKVDKTIFESFCNADSKGTYFAKYIKNNFTTTKVDNDTIKNVLLESLK